MALTREPDSRAMSRAARDITFATEAQSATGRILIRLMENATGRLGLIKRADGYADAVSKGGDFWQVILARYGVSLDIIGGALDNIPKDRPVIVVANHPFGILDGLMMGHLLSLVRGPDFRILANRVFKRSDELDRVILPISFDPSREAQTANIATRAAALDYLGQGGCIGLFPGGTVSTSARPFGRAMDPGWRSFTARMVARSDAVVVPIYFDGANSRLFQLASHLHATLRMGLLIREFKARIDTPVRAVIGAPVARDEITPFARDAKKMMDFLRAQTYALSPVPLSDIGHGFEFEDKYRATPRRGPY